MRRFIFEIAHRVQHDDFACDHRDLLRSCVESRLHFPDSSEGRRETGAAMPPYDFHAFLEPTPRGALYLFLGADGPEIWTIFFTL